MKHYFITFRSVTFAQRGERLLSRQGIRCSLRRTPKWMEAQGCGYSLRLSSADIDRAVALLRKEEIPFRRVYIQQENGRPEEVAL